MAFLNETGLQELRARLEAVYARKVSQTARMYGSTSDTQGKVIEIPYFEVNENGLIDEAGTKFHTVVFSVTPPTISRTQSTYNVYEYTGSRNYYTYYRHTVTITRTNDAGTTYYTCDGSSSSFSGASANVATINNESRSSTRSYSVTAYTNDNGIVSGTASASYTIPVGTYTCGCSCSCRDT